MDKKGFFVGIISRSKGTFTKAMWASKDRTAATQDGSRVRITFIACVCVSVEVLPPALFYKGKLELQSSWIDAVQ
jgi:hypothetical protein